MSSFVSDGEFDLDGSTGSSLPLRSLTYRADTLLDGPGKRTSSAGRTGSHHQLNSLACREASHT